MKKEKKSEESFLRQKAEEIIKNKKNAVTQNLKPVVKKKELIKTSSKLSEAESLKLIHELEVHQIELKMQYEEILLAKEQAEKAAEKYTALYDFAPSGYFTLSKDGNIIQLNLCGANMLGKERSNIKNSRFTLFVSDKTKPIFILFLEEIFNSNSKVYCEVELINNSNDLSHVYLSGIIDEENKQCHVTAIDITERKRTEEELKQITHDLKHLNSFFVDRECRMIELKREINKLLKESGKENKYVIVE